MKKVVRVLSVILSFVLIFSTTSIAFAKEDVTPVIVVHGLGGTDIYKNVGTDDEQKLPQFGLDVKAMLSNQDILTEAMKLLSDETKPDYNKLFKALGDYFRGVDYNYTKNGNAKKGQEIKTYWTDSIAKHEEYLSLRAFSVPVMAKQATKLIGKKNVYAFNFDWRQDLRLTAKQLNSMIKSIKKNTGAKKVSIVCLSLGGAVISAYMDAYKKQKDVSRYVIVQSAMLGADISRILGLDFQLNKKDVLSYLSMLEKTLNSGEKETLFRAIQSLGDVRIGCLVDHLDKDILSNPKMKKKFFKEVVKPWISNVPAIYECVPYNQFDKVVNKAISLGFFEKDGKLHKKLKKYHAVQGRFKKNIKWVKKHGAQVAIICDYGIKALPLTSQKNNHSDLLIDTKYASGGATVAKYGKKLKKKGKYVSPDKVIDASTGVLPDNTWYIKNVCHGLIYENSDVDKLIANLACGKVKFNLKAVKKKYGYSQFLKVNSKQKLSNVKK